MTSGTNKKRKIIKIDEEKCDGCGDCVPSCAEGAIQVIEGKARLVGDLFCDGLGACLGHCPQGAITLEEREAVPYDERPVAAHCPGSQAMRFELRKPEVDKGVNHGSSQLRHWPIQLHLINPLASHYQGSDLLLAADCVPFALGSFHAGYLRGRTLTIGCPKLDDGQDVYVEKLTALIDKARINSITIMIMQVPCCGGLLRLAQMALARSQCRPPTRCIVVSLQGEILREEKITQP